MADFGSMETQMSDWEDFLALDNFRLAWERILRSSHYHNKDRFGLKVYSANLKTNLEYLIDRVKAKTYTANMAQKLYISKASGGVRSLPFLSIEDRIVYQAIANIIARRSKDTFEAIVQGHVFAHLLGEPDDVFMLRQWRGPRGQYQRFLNKFQVMLQKGYQWVVEADIAAYYDSIDHHLLCNGLQKYLDGNELLKLLTTCLRVWTPHKDGHELSRGLPQGYQASDYLATLFLLPIDRLLILQSGDYQYIRYVDDFRILAQDLYTAERGLVELDVFLKGQGLILKGTKTSIRKADDVDKELHRLAKKLSMLSMLERRKVRGDHIGREASFLFYRAWHTLKTSKVDKHAETNLIFGMNRMPPSKFARKIAMDMLRQMPWRSRDITNYLSRFKEDGEMVGELSTEMRKHKAYSWHLANCLHALSRIAEASVYRGICKDWISNTNFPWYQRLAAVKALRDDPDSYSFLMLRYVEEVDHLIRREMLVSAMLSASTDHQRAFAIRKGKKDQHPEIIAAAVWFFLEFPECGIDENEFGEEIGHHRKMIPIFWGSGFQAACYIKECLTKRFDVNIPNDLDFRMVFDSTYDQAVSSLRRAERSYDTDPNSFNNYLDSFNQVIAIRVSETLEGESIPKNEYGNILKSLKKNYGIIAAHFSRCHELRSGNLVSHAFDKSLGDWSQNVTHREKDKLVQGISAAYQQFVDAFASA